MSDYCYGFPIFERVATQAARMHDMLRHAGVEAVDLIRREHGESWYEARTLCLECSNDRSCGTWLAAHDAGIAAVPEFCPNARLFEEVRQSRSGHSRRCILP